MKIGSTKDKLQIQEQEIFITAEKRRSIAIDGVVSLFSTLSTAADINPNPQEDKFSLRKKPKKKKNGRRLS